jgi:hypothetical protein
MILIQLEKLVLANYQKHGRERVHSLGFAHGLPPEPADAMVANVVPFPTRLVECIRF